MEANYLFILCGCHCNDGVRFLLYGCNYKFVGRTDVLLEWGNIYATWQRMYFSGHKTGHVDVVYRGIWASKAYYADYYGGNPYPYEYRTNVFH